MRGMKILECHLLQFCSKLSGLILNKMHFNHTILKAVPLSIIKITTHLFTK